MFIKHRAQQPSIQCQLPEFSAIFDQSRLAFPSQSHQAHPRISASRVVSLTAGGYIVNASGGRISGGTMIASGARDILALGGSGIAVIPEFSPF